MITFLVIAGAILLLAAIVLAFCVLSAPEGHEDAAGFHAEVRSGSFWDHAKLGDTPRESPGVHR